MMRHSVRAAAILIAVVAAAAPASAGSSDEVRTQGTCTQGALATTVAAENLRPFVPDAFPLILDESGTATIFVYTLACDGYRVGDGADGGAMITGVAAFVRPPDGSPGVEGYDLLMTTDHSAYHRGVTALGLFQGLVEVTMTIDPVAGPVVGLEADTPWSYSPYSYSMTSAAPPPVGVTFPSVHWQLGSRGLVRSDYTHTSFILTPGVGEIRAAGESPLARILGATTVRAAGGILRFSFTGTTKLVEPSTPQSPSAPTKRPTARLAGERLADTGVGSQPAGVTLLASAAALAAVVRARQAG